jgi:YD repeat-containing protein
MTERRLRLSACVATCGIVRSTRRSTLCAHLILAQALYATTHYAYDVLDDLTAVTQAGQSRTFVYDSLKRLKQATNPESGAVNDAYDGNSNLQTKTDARSITTTFAYDALNRGHHKSATSFPNGAILHSNSFQAGGLSIGTSGKRSTHS